MISLMVVLAIVISIALGYRTKINTGLFAISFAYIIGAFFLDLSANEIIAMWPIKIFFVIFAVSLFYNFATVNGTLENLAEQLLYKTRKVPHLLPFVVFFAAVIISGLGAGYFTVLAFMAPITLILAEKTGLSKLVGAIAINYGSLAGANFMTSASGIIFKGLIEDVGYSNPYSYTTPIFLASMIIPLIVISGFVFFTESGKSVRTDLEISKPKPFNDVQKSTLSLIIIMVVIVLAAPIAELILPNSEAVSFVSSKIDIGLIAIVFSVVALLLDLGDQKEVISRVPWNTLIMISGVGMLISVAIEAGTIDILSGWVGTNIPPLFVPVAMCIIAGFMSFFSSTLGVVAPALFPTVTPIALATGINPTVLFIAIIVGAQGTSISPFSSGGSLILGSVGDEERDEMFSELMFKGAPICLLAATIFSSILAFIL